MPQKEHPTSWHNVGKWYDDSVGKEGHYYHQHLIIPNLLRLCQFQPDSSLLDLACGQGILSHHIPNIPYTGIDVAPSLIQAARQHNKNPQCQFLLGDVTKPLPTQKKDFSHATIILATQNIESPESVFKNASHHLKQNGQLILILNHPCFRIPRQSSWQIDPEKKIQFRRIDRYMSPLKIPIQTHPAKGQNSPQTLSFHFPLSTYSQALHSTGFLISNIEEWCSNKISEGKSAKMENRSRQEFPLFICIACVKR